MPSNKTTGKATSARGKKTCQARASKMNETSKATSSNTTSKASTGRASSKASTSKASTSRAKNCK